MECPVDFERIELVPEPLGRFQPHSPGAWLDSAPGLRGGLHPAPELLAVELVPDVEEAGTGRAGSLELAIEEPAGRLGEGDVRGALGQRAGDPPAGDDPVLVPAEE